MQKKLILQGFEDLKNAIVLLEASIEKFRPYDRKKVYTPLEMEYYDSLSFRFEKSVELMLIFFKTVELFVHAKASDTLRDRLLVMQKMKIVQDIDFWLEARLLRNKITHTYIRSELKDLYSEINVRSKVIFKTMAKIEKYLAGALF